MREPSTSTWSRSPFAVTDDDGGVSVFPEGRVRYLIIRGARDDGAIGVVGAIWLSEDGRRGGVIAHPEARWAAGEMTRSYAGARDRGWTPDRIYAYWVDSAHEPWDLQVDPPDVAEGVQALRRYVEAA